MTFKDDLAYRQRIHDTRKAALAEYAEHGIALEAYSPLGRGRHLGTKTVTAIANRLGRTPAQVLLRWCVQHDVPAIPKSTHRAVAIAFFGSYAIARHRRPTI